jgi:hypothetical protein
MIEAYDAPALSWIQTAEGLKVRVVVTAISLDEGADTYHWLINGCKEECWFGLPLTIELMRDKLKWFVSEGRLGIVTSPEPNGTPQVVFAVNDLIFYLAPGFQVSIQYLHELQKFYRISEGKNLNVEL